MPASLCCSGEREMEGGWEAEVGRLAGSGEVDDELGGLLPRESLPGGLLPGGEEVLPELLGDELVEDGEPGLAPRETEVAVGLEVTPETETAGGSAADCPTAASRVGPQLAASRKKVMRMAAAALRMFQACLLPCLPRLLAEPLVLAPMRFEKRTRVGFLFKTAGAFSLLLPGTQTNLGRFCGGGGSRLPTSWG